MSDDDVVERLRLAAKPEEWTSVWGLTVVRCSLMREAADEIERLREASNRWKHVAALFGEAFAIDEFGQYVPSDGSDVFRAVLAYEQAKREEADRD